MPTRKREPRARALARAATACLVAAALAASMGLGEARADTALGIRIFDSKQTPSTGVGGTALGIRVHVPSYDVIWKANGGVWPDGSDADKATSVAFGSATLPPATPTRSGYTLGGWSRTSNGAVEALPTETVGAATWHAVWAANSYRVALDPGEGAGGTLSVDAEYGSAMPAIEPPSRTGHSFAGYYDDGGKRYYDSSGASAGSWDKAADATLRARWTANRYAVSFDANGGEGGQVEGVEATYGEPLPAIAATPPRRHGYAFAGWFDREAGGVRYYDEEGASVRDWDKAGDAVLYAHWTLQVKCAVPSSVLVVVDASGEPTVSRQAFESSTVEEIEVVGVRSAQLGDASAVFLDAEALADVRVTLTPPDGAGPGVEVPLATTGDGVPVGFAIAKEGRLEVAFGLKIPKGARLTYMPDVQRSITQLSYTIAASASR